MGVDVSFTIDQFASRELLLQLDFYSDTIVNISLDSEVLEEAFDTSLEVYQNKDLNLSLGPHNLTVTSPSSMTAVSVKVEGKAPEGSSPLTLESWTSLGEGDLNLTLAQPEHLVLMARVVQGNKAVVGATVIAFVNRDDGGLPVQVELQDNGQGADHVAGDGLYAKYFLDFLPNQPSKRYSLSCKVEGTNETKVNHGPNDTRREAGDQPTCCGSSAVGPDSDLQETGSFVRAQAGGLISILPTTGVDLNDLYPPSKVSD